MPANTEPQAAQQEGGDALDALEQALAEDTATVGGDEPDEWTPPTREEWEAQQAEHRKALETEQGKLKRAREQAKRLREGKTATATTGGASGDTQDGAPDLAPEVDKWRRAALQQSAEAALLKRGADPEMVDLALGRLRITEIEVDDSGRPELDDWLDEMEDRYPKLFAPKAAAPGTQTGPRQVGRVDQGKAAGGTPVVKPLSLGEQIIANSEAARLRARRGR